MSRSRWTLRASCAAIVALGISPAAMGSPLSAAVAATYRVSAVSRAVCGPLHELQVRLSLRDLERLSVVPEGHTGTATKITASQLLTNQHVVSGTRTVTVTSGSGEPLDAHVTWVSTDLDLAMLTLDTPVDGDAIPLRQPAPPLGTPVFTLGHPMSGPAVVSRGVLSGVTERGIQGRTRRTYLVTDAVVQPGHSGGPLIDEQGAAVGLLVGGFGPSSGAEGFGLALPAETIVTALQTATHQADTATELDLADEGDGARVIHAPAYARHLGLQDGDYIASHTPAALADARTAGPVVVRLDNGLRVVLPRTNGQP